MAYDLIPLDGGRVPSVRGRRSNLIDNAKAGVQGGFGIVTYRGRNWSLRYRGAAQMLRDDRNAPVSTLDVVLVGIAEGISKQYYAKTYSEGDDNAPDCMSTDGVKPDAGVQNKQSAQCANCRHNQWGSKITDGGKRAKACQDSRRLAIVPLGDIENEGYGGPMLLRIPPMSLNNLANYADFLQRKGASFETVGTQLGFDYDVAYPRITFRALGFLTDEQLDLVIGKDGESGVCADPLISRILGEERVASLSPSPDPAPDEPGEEGDDEEPQEDEPQEAAAPPPPPPAAATKNPFASAIAAAPRAAAPAPQPASKVVIKKAPPKTLAAAPAPKSNGSVEQAPSNMEAAIHNLLDT